MKPGLVAINYKPTEPGIYAVNIKFADHHVKGEHCGLWAIIRRS